MSAHLDSSAEDAVENWATSGLHDVGPVTLLRYEMLRKPDLLRNVQRIESYLAGRSDLVSRLLRKGLVRSPYAAALYYQWVLQSDWVDRSVNIYLWVRDPEKLTLDCEQQQERGFPRTKLSVVYVDALSTEAGCKRFTQLLANRLLLEREDLVLHADQDMRCTG